MKPSPIRLGGGGHRIHTPKVQKGGSAPAAGAGWPPPPLRRKETKDRSSHRYGDAEPPPPFPWPAALARVAQAGKKGKKDEAEASSFGDSLRRRIAAAPTDKERARLEEVLERKLKIKEARAQILDTPRYLDVFAAGPSWSVRSLLPPHPAFASASASSSSTSTSTPTPANITPDTLRHLLRLSALPAPANEAEQAAMLSTLETQLHFVRDIQTVDTQGVEPLRAVRDETTQGLEREEAALERAAKAALNKEVRFGYQKRPRRVPLEHKITPTEAIVEEATRARRQHGFFVVDSGKAKRGQ